MKDQGGIAPDIWAGLASMLVVLPSSIAFGALVYSPLGEGYIAAGAAAGIVGSILIGIIAPLCGGTKRLISGPSAPAAAVMATMALELCRQKVPAEHALLLISLSSLAAGALQFLYGAVGGGGLIKYIPYPVGAGYLAGVGLLIFLSQLPRLLGLPSDVALAQGLLRPELWSPQSIGVGAVTISLIFLGPRLSKAVPASIIGILGGIAAYFAMGAFDHKLLALAGNPLIIGPMQTAGPQTIDAAIGRWASLGGVTWGELRLLAAPTLALSLLLSFDTLKTCVIVDVFSPARHDSDKELRGQGLANIAAGLSGGLSGSGQLGPTLVNINSGARTNLSSILDGLFCLAAFLALGRFIAWVPVAALAAVLIMISARMFDSHVLSLIKQRATTSDYGVVAAVMLVAVFWNLIAATAVGVGLATFLFTRDQMRASVIRRKTDGSQCFSKQERLPSEMRVLEARGAQTAVCELQGSLFFGTADQLYTKLEKDLFSRKYIILDMRRVQAIDITATRVLGQMEARLALRGGRLLFSDLPRRFPTGLELENYLDHGPAKGKDHARVFPELDDALTWTENQLLLEGHAAEETGLLAPEEIELLRGLKPKAASALHSCLDERNCSKGSLIFKHGDAGDELFIIRRGRVRIDLPVTATRTHHAATFARGDCFGEVAFLDGGKRSADAKAAAQTDLFVLSRRRFDKAALEVPGLSGEIFSALARLLALRLRRTNVELQALRED